MSSRYSLKVSVSGVRGIAGESLTPSIVVDFASSFGEYVGRGRVLVGRDTRPTGAMFEHAVVAGLLSVGCQPMLAGIVPTPTLQMLVEEYNARGGIVISASHNPVEWNAMKFIGPSGIFLNHTEAAELLDVYNQPDRMYVEEQDYRNIRRVEKTFEIHRERIMRNIDVDLIRKSKFKVAIDCCNGAGAIYSIPFLEELGCTVVPVFTEPDGVFRRKPEPVPENTGELCSVVRNNGCDIGFAQDPDADRISFVRSDGTPAGEQYSLVLAAEHILSKSPGPVVVNIQTTKAVEDIAVKYGSPVFYTEVGEVNVTGKMLSESALIGGEGSSGGVIWPAVHPCRDSFSAMAIVLEMMALREKSIDGILDSMPRYFTSNRKFGCSAETARRVVRQLRKDYAAHGPVTADGIRVNMEKSWFLVRPSNTEPVLRLTVEAVTEHKTADMMSELTGKIDPLIRKFER